MIFVGVIRSMKMNTIPKTTMIAGISLTLILIDIFGQEGIFDME
jgi:hypothetical protein